MAILFIVEDHDQWGYLLQAVVEEKENRTMEIIVTPVSHAAMAGKIIGNISVGPPSYSSAVFQWTGILVASRSIPFLSILNCR